MRNDTVYPSSARIFARSDERQHASNTQKSLHTLFYGYIAIYADQFTQTLKL